MSTDQLFEALQENIRQIYRKSVDADNSLDQLRKQDKGKFTTIFNKEQGFSTESNRFQPYAEELGRDLLALQNDTSAENLQTELPKLVKKIEIYLQMLTVFKSNAR